jgi:hypothetical protein
MLQSMRNFLPSWVRSHGIEHGSTARRADDTLVHPAGVAGLRLAHERQPSNGQSVSRWRRTVRIEPTRGGSPRDMRAHDARAIGKAASRRDQQAALMHHASRHLLIEQRTGDFGGEICAAESVRTRILDAGPAPSVCARLLGRDQLDQRQFRNGLSQPARSRRAPAKTCRLGQADRLRRGDRATRALKIQACRSFATISSGGVEREQPTPARAVARDIQWSNSRRKRAPCLASSSCDGASGRQIDAAFAISTVPGVKDSMTAAPSYSTSRSASRIPIQSW